MPDVIPLWYVPIYSLAWVGIARVAVEMWRVSERGRARRQMLLRLWRWKNC